MRIDRMAALAKANAQQANKANAEFLCCSVHEFLDLANQAQAHIFKIRNADGISLCFDYIGVRFMFQAYEFGAVV